MSGVRYRTGRLAGASSWLEPGNGKRERIGMQ